MIEYITKEQAISVVKEAIANIVNSDSETVNLTDLEIEIQMTITDYTDAADVAPVAHAYWRGIEGDGYDPDGNIVWDTFECSNCGEEHHADGEPEWDYCPSCGARMGGEELEPADVAPVAHAYWRGIEGDGYDPDGNIVWDTFECSNCGEEHHADGEPTWDYCPQCGARMDGEENG